jgi:hypothetical protein
VWVPAEFPTRRVSREASSGLSAVRASAETRRAGPTSCGHRNITTALDDGRPAGPTLPTATESSHQGVPESEARPAFSEMTRWMVGSSLQIRVDCNNSGGRRVRRGCESRSPSMTREPCSPEDYRLPAGGGCALTAARRRHRRSAHPPHRRPRTRRCPRRSRPGAPDRPPDGGWHRPGTRCRPCPCSRTRRAAP